MRNSYLLVLLTLVSALAQIAPPPEKETVVVTGTFEPLSLEEIDRAIRVLPVRSENLILNTLVDALKLDPSLDVRERAPDGVQADLSIRGGSFGQTLILLNGQRLNDVQSGHHNMDIPVPLESVSRIEVMRGSGSTLYGSDAVAGVINIVTAPPETTEFRLRTAYGSDGINQQRGALAFAGRKLAEQLTFSRDFSSGFRADRDYRNLEFASITRWNSTYGSGTLNLAYMDHPFGADQFYGNFNSWENTKTWFAGIQQPFGEKTTASFAFRRHSDLFVLYRDRPQVFTNHHSDESYQLAVRRREELGANTTLFYGVEGLHESIVSNNLGDHARSRAAAYAALDLRALKRYSLTLSVREEVYRRFSGAFTPTVAGGVWLSPVMKLRASASRAFRIPSYTDLYYHDPGNVGSPGLRPERAWTYETGLDWLPTTHTRADLTLFERRERDGIDFYRASPTDIYRALNIQNLNFRGVEAGVRWTPSRVHTIDLRYTGLHGSQDTIAAGATKYAFNYPKNSGVVSWTTTPTGNFLFRTRVGVLDRRARSPYALWDAYVAMPKGSVHPFVQASNLANTSYQEVLGVPMPGRTIIGGVELVFRKR
ncbi:MAG TPA: TonB-dependent receptor [Candidatus Solibacter sp.]|nr:TonB-dependent receptor [Candidatus Solibacter sp.]